MVPARDILDAVRLAAVWLLAASVLFGAWGFGPSTALAAESNACEVACPCDGTLDDGHPEPDGHAERDDAPHDGDCEDDCKDDCPDCSCRPVVTMAIAALTIRLDSPLSTIDRTLAPPDAPTVGAFSGVFRPPRSLV